MICMILAIGTPGILAARTSIDVWNIDTGEISPVHYLGETVANGMIGFLSTPAPFRTEQTVIYGAYEQLWPGSVSSIIRCFSFLDITMSIDGEPIRSSEQVQHFHQTLSLREGALTTSFDYGDKATIHYTVRALRDLPHNALMEITVVAKRPIRITVGSLMGTPTSERGGEASFSWLNDTRVFRTMVEMDSQRAHDLAIYGATAKGPSGALTIAAAQSFVFDGPILSWPSVTVKDEGLSFTREVSAGAYHFALVGTAITSAHVADPINEAQRLTTAAVIQGTRALIERHQAAWEKLWESDIVIGGDDQVQRDVHSMLYHLYSFVREGSGYSIPPMGLSSTDYVGHIFWDADCWMLPPLLVLHPQLARSLLDYRFERLDAARKNAARNGYQGAEFPWESAATGEEETRSDLTGGPLEVHVTATVALATWNYYRMTKDRAWLYARGYPILEATADYWVSRVSKSASGGYEIRHVVAADEYANDVDNDAFTNAAARENIAAAISAARILGQPINPEWEVVSSGLSYVRYDNGATREYSHYDGQIIKQADANLLAYPLHTITDPNSIRRDLDFYSARFDERAGPAMTKSIFAILYERLNMPNKAYDWFKSGYEPNKRPPFGVLTESAESNNPYFATSAGGLLQAMLYGFGGLDITDDGIVQRTSKLPHPWQSLTLTGIGPTKKTYNVN